MKDDVKQSIVQLGLDYRLMTQFTSFVAVEEMIVTDGGNRAESMCRSRCRRA